MAEAWARYGRGNVIIVDWRVHALSFYTKITTKLVFEIADTILALLELIRELRGNQQPEEFYPQIDGAGHSLGAQILGILGTKIRKKFNTSNVESPAVLLNNLYALDPAGFWLYNSYVEIHPEDFEYLSVDSASLVMVLHTTRNYTKQTVKLGLRYLLGHYDFYVYVAEGLDEWCPSAIDEVCEHLIAVGLFKAAMEPTENDVDRLVGFKCHDLVAKGDGDAMVKDQPQAVFGLNRPDAPTGNAYYLPINNQSPYNFVPNKTERDMKRCDVFEKEHPDRKTKRKVMDIKFTTEKTEAAKNLRIKKDAKSFSKK